MSKSSNPSLTEKFHFPNSRKLWHLSIGQSEPLGCARCHYRESCGGLQLEASIFDCLTFCRCADSASCDNVCPRNIRHLVARSGEVHGFDLKGIASAPALPLPSLPLMVPMIYHSSARRGPPTAPVVALSLYELFNKRSGTLRFSTRPELLNHFKLDPSAQIILSGTDPDPSLERWWSLAEREVVTRGLMQLGVALITTPNYSLFDDVPRPDNLYNMKRIGLIWSEIQREGISCALHLNARTDRDWERWTEFLARHVEIATVAFEFGTGAGTKQRMEWYVERICAVAREMNRELHLIVRGGLNALPRLREAFAGVTFIDTAAFIKAQKRQRALLREGQLTWQKAPTPLGTTIDELLDWNIAVVEAHVRAGEPTAVGLASATSVPFVPA